MAFLTSYFIVLINIVNLMPGDLKMLNDTKLSNSTLDLEDEKSLIIFQNLFKQKRIEQIGAVKKILKFKYEQQYKMMLMMLDQTFQDALSSKLIIENSDYILGALLPKNITLRDALFQLMTTTTLYSEFQLRMPDITDRIVMTHKDWDLLIKWLIGFTNSTGIFDDKTANLIHLVSQEIYLVERSPDYVNPYRVNAMTNPIKDENGATASAKKSKPKPSKGPRITKPKHSEF